jgi:two-component system, NarL family, sensor histidine kinase UhpB
MRRDGTNAAHSTSQNGVCLANSLGLPKAGLASMSQNLRRCCSPATSWLEVQDRYPAPGEGATLLQKTETELRVGSERNMTVAGSKHRPIRGAAFTPASGWRPWFSTGAGKLSRWVWYDRTVQWQLLAIFILINLVTAIAAGGVVIYNAHNATAVEVAASMAVAEQVVRRTTDQLAPETSRIHPADSLTLRALESMPLRLRHLRHVRISIVDASGRELSVPPADVDRDRGEHTGTPRWFAALFRLDTLKHEVPVTLSGRRIGTVLVTSQPADEIAEVWKDFSDLAAVVLIANVVVMGLLYLALGRALSPLTSLAAGFRELEQGRFRHRLPRSRVRELADIVDRFNALASTTRCRA